MGIPIDIQNTDKASHDFILWRQVLVDDANQPVKQHGIDKLCHGIPASDGLMLVQTGDNLFTPRDNLLFHDPLFKLGLVYG